MAITSQKLFLSDNYPKVKALIYKEFEGDIESFKLLSLYFRVYLHVPNSDCAGAIFGYTRVTFTRKLEPLRQKFGAGNLSALIDKLVTTIRTSNVDEIQIQENDYAYSEIFEELLILAASGEIEKALAELLSLIKKINKSHNPDSGETKREYDPTALKILGVGINAMRLWSAKIYK